MSRFGQLVAGLTGHAAADATAEAPIAFPATPSPDALSNLTPLQYHVTQEAGTERPFTGSYLGQPRRRRVPLRRVPRAAVRLAARSSSRAPAGRASTTSVAQGHVVTKTDRTFGMSRTEARCANCGAHLGHVFDDGPRPDRAALLHQLGVACIRAAFRRGRDCRVGRAAGPCGPPSSSGLPLLETQAAAARERAPASDEEPRRRHHEQRRQDPSPVYVTRATTTPDSQARDGGRRPDDRVGHALDARPFRDVEIGREEVGPGDEAQVPAIARAGTGRRGGGRRRRPVTRRRAARRTPASRGPPGSSADCRSGPPAGPRAARAHTSRRCAR